MKDKDKSREQLVNELAELRQRVDELEAREAGYKRTKETLHRPSEEMARSQRLLLALGQAAQAVQRARTPEEVYQTLGDEIVKLGYHATIFTLTDDRTHLVVSHLTFESALLRTAEKLTGLSARKYRFLLVPGGFYQRFIAEGKTVFSDPVAESMTEALPGPVRPLADRLAATLGLEQAIYAPLKVGGDTHSILAVIGRDLTEDAVPAVSAFASQAAIAIENARLYQKAQQEITERRRTEQALRESEKKYRELVDNSLVGIYITQNRILKFCNQRLVEIFGYRSTEEIIGKHVQELIAPESWERMDAEAELRYSGRKRTSHYELRGVRADGTVFEAEILGMRITYQGEPAIQGALTDIT
ncbi:MAG: PAS domain S-box protein, partial [Anaerolineae bacterium]